MSKEEKKLNLFKLINKPLRVGGKTILKRLVLAPMTILGNIAFRELLSHYGGYGLLFSEMCSAKQLPNENPLNSGYFRWREAEREHLIFQIFGSNPSEMSDAAKRIEFEGFFGVDINFGCSVASICQKNCGAALLKKPDLAAKIVNEVRKSVSIPLFVKFRTGWKDDPDIPVELARRFEDAGADALTFHPRISPDRRARCPRWEYIAMVKNAVKIPVFGNGNVFDASSCLKMICETRCDGIAVGRMAVAQPWCFAQWSEGFEPDVETHRNAAILLTWLMEKHYKPSMGLRRFKKFALYFSSNFQFGHTLFSQIKNTSSMNEVRKILIDFFSFPQNLLSRPNLNFLV